MTLLTASDMIKCIKVCVLLIIRLYKLFDVDLSELYQNNNVKKIVQVGLLYNFVRVYAE